MLTDHHSAWSNTRVYPSFNDAPHERPILSLAGTNRAILILGGLLLAMVGFALLLMLL